VTVPLTVSNPSLGIDIVSCGPIERVDADAVVQPVVAIFAVERFRAITALERGGSAQ
jgi:hypothetical protein